MDKALDTELVRGAVRDVVADTDGADNAGIPVLESAVQDAAAPATDLDDPVLVQVVAVGAVDDRDLDAACPAIVLREDAGPDAVFPAKDSDGRVPDLVYPAIDHRPAVGDVDLDSVDPAIDHRLVVGDVVLDSVDPAIDHRPVVGDVVLDLEFPGQGSGVPATVHAVVAELAQAPALAVAELVLAPVREELVPASVAAVLAVDPAGHRLHTPVASQSAMPLLR